MNIVDPHLHLFDLSAGEYEWLKPDHPPFWPDKHLINKSFTERDLTLESPLNLVAFVHVEAGFNNTLPWRELAFLQRRCITPFKAVAFCDITVSPALFRQNITRLQQESSLVGIRHILDDDAFSILSLPQVLDNFQFLSDNALSFDCQLSLLDHLAVDQLVKVLSRVPELVCIVNHAGCPPLLSKNQQWYAWQQNLEKLSSLPRVVIKCSGWEMTDRNYTQQWVSAVITSCVRAFGHQRVMLASNYPLCLFSCSYQQYWQSIIDHIPVELIAHLCEKNAKKWYKLENDSQ